MMTFIICLAPYSLALVMKIGLAMLTHGESPPIIAYIEAQIVFTCLIKSILQSIALVSGFNIHDFSFHYSKNHFIIFSSHRY